jgi:viroplasmin and RNaseH domain-containing protein
MPYVVYRGRVLGFYIHWEDCLKQVNMFKDNSYKGYKTMAEAEARWRNHLREESVTPQP